MLTAKLTQSLFKSFASKKVLQKGQFQIKNMFAATRSCHFNSNNSVNSKSSSDNNLGILPRRIISSPDYINNRPLWMGTEDEETILITSPEINNPEHQLKRGLALLEMEDDLEALNLAGMCFERVLELATEKYGDLAREHLKCVNKLIEKLAEKEKSQENITAINS